MKSRTIVFTEAQIEKINRALGLEQVKTGQRKSFRRGVANMAARWADKMLEVTEDKTPVTG